jgi:protein arginine N-methyltransferase 5
VVNSDSDQDPLYLPSNAELHVSIWRLTDQRRVWYEWYAESFLRMPSLSLGGGEGVDAATVFASASAPAISEIGKRTGGIEMVKIGQTSLHNPDGRSSWIGL